MTEWIPTVCYMCQNCCSVIVKKEDGVVIKIEGNPDSPHNDGKTCAKGNSAIMGLYAPNRVLRPLKRTNKEKGIGIDPGWVEVTWEEALQAVVDRLVQVRAKDPRGLMFLMFDPQSFSLIGPAFMSAFGTPNLAMGAAQTYCGNNVHNITFPVHGSFFAEPDYEYANYCLLFGSQNGFGIGTNPMGLAKRLAEARAKRKIRMVVVDPVCGQAASKADEWIPIRPGTDPAFALGIANILVNELGIYDREFLVWCTNAPYLIGPDGLYLRDPETKKPMVWDQAAGRPRPFNHPQPVAPALSGEFTAGSVSCSTAFTLLSKHLLKYTPEYVAEITGIPATTTARVAREFGKAACIGSKIVIDGQELPYRPAHVDWNRGPSAHKHSLIGGWALQLLNTLVGAIDVPGGHLGVNVVDPLGTWSPTECPDGMIVPGMPYARGGTAYPPKIPCAPNAVGLNELFPVSIYSSAFPMVLNDPERFKLPYRIEMIINTRSNPVLNNGDPQFMASALKRVPFMVSFAQHIDETTEFADIVLPDTHYLETLTAFPNLHIEWMLAGRGDWYQTLRQPVVEPPPGVRSWMDTLVSVAYRVGISADLNKTLNTVLKLKGDLRLEGESSYNYEEIADRWAKAMFGEQYDLEWFRAKGLIKVAKDIRHAYPRPFIKGRVPLYLEHYKRMGEQVKAVTAEMGLDWWDVSDYEPLPEWRPCPGFNGDPGWDLWIVNYKVPYHTHSITYNNPWLGELSELYPGGRTIVINPQTAGSRNIADGDRIRVESADGRTLEGVARLSQGIHPEVLGTVCSQGHWAKGHPFATGRGIHYNSLIPFNLERFDFISTAIDSCVKVRVSKV